MKKGGYYMKIENRNFRSMVKRITKISELIQIYSNTKNVNVEKEKICILILYTIVKLYEYEKNGKNPLYLQNFENLYQSLNLSEDYVFTMTRFVNFIQDNENNNDPLEENNYKLIRQTVLDFFAPHNRNENVMATVNDLISSFLLCKLDFSNNFKLLSDFKERSFFVSTNSITETELKNIFIKHIKSFTNPRIKNLEEQLEDLKNDTDESEYNKNIILILTQKHSEQKKILESINKKTEEQINLSIFSDLKETIQNICFNDIPQNFDKETIINKQINEVFLQIFGNDLLKSLKESSKFLKISDLYFSITKENIEIDPRITNAVEKWSTNKDITFEEIPFYFVVGTAGHACLVVYLEKIIFTIGYGYDISKQNELKTLSNSMISTMQGSVKSPDIFFNVMSDKCRDYEIFDIGILESSHLKRIMDYMEDVKTIKYGHENCDTYTIDNNTFYLYLPNENCNRYNCVSFMRYLFPHIKCISTTKMTLEADEKISKEGQYPEMPEYCRYSLNKQKIFRYLLENDKQNLLDEIEKNKLIYNILNSENKEYFNDDIIISTLANGSRYNINLTNHLDNNPNLIYNGEVNSIYFSNCKECDVTKYKTGINISIYKNENINETDFPNSLKFVNGGKKSKNNKSRKSRTKKSKKKKSAKKRL